MNHAAPDSSIMDTILADARTRWSFDSLGTDVVRRDDHLLLRAALSGKSVTLRITPPAVRTPIENQAECDFLSFLNREGIAVALPTASRRGRDVEPIEHDGEIWSASVFGQVPGRQIQPGTAAFTSEFVEEWGGVLGRLHRAAEDYRPVAGWKRNDWDADYRTHMVDHLFGPDDASIQRDLEAVIARLQALPQTAATYGMIHGDLRPPNLRSDLGRGLTVLAFEQCGYHWYTWDIAAALGHTLWDDAEQRAWLYRHFFKGYLRERPVGTELTDELGTFFRLWVLNRYLTQRRRIGLAPAADRAILDRLKSDLDRPIDWKPASAAARPR